MTFTKNDLEQVRYEHRLAENSPSYPWSWQCRIRKKQIDLHRELFESQRKLVKSEFSRSSDLGLSGNTPNSTNTMEI